MSKSTLRDNAPPSWALTWAADREDDRRGLKVAFGFALLVHAALLAVRLAEDTVVLPPVDAVVRFPIQNLVLKKPEPLPPPELVREAPLPGALRVPVPAELVPPEPLPVRDVAFAPIELPVVAPIASIPEPPPVAADAPVRLTREMDRPVRIAGLDPAYTEMARKAREEGTVILDAVIDKTGAVTEIEVLKELGFGLTEAAVRAVGAWRFEPARLDGRPTAVRYSLTVRFALR